MCKYRARVLVLVVEKQVEEDLACDNSLVDNEVAAAMPCYCLLLSLLFPSQ